MIPVRSGVSARLTKAWFDRYCTFALWRHFHAIRLYGSFPVAPISVGAKLVVSATHQSFWDGIILNDLLRRHGWRRRHVMIDARQVRRHPFFTRIGGFGVELDDPADRRRAIRYAAHLLQSADEPTALVVFPQGRIEPEESPLDELPRTPTLVARRAGAAVVHVAIRYRHWFAQRPELLIATADDLPAAQARLDEACRTFAPGRRLAGGRRSIKDLSLRGLKPPPPDVREQRLQQRQPPGT